METRSSQSRKPIPLDFQLENGKLSDHEHSSVTEHLRLLLPMVLSVARPPRAEAPPPGEWQEDSGLGLYRAPEEGASSPVPPVDLDKKVCLCNYSFQVLLFIIKNTFVE